MGHWPNGTSEASRRDGVWRESPPEGFLADSGGLDVAVIGSGGLLRNSPHDIHCRALRPVRYAGPTWAYSLRWFQRCS